MISDAERREVAGRMRSKKPEEFGQPLAQSVFRHVFRSLYPKQIYPVSNWVLRMPYVIAGLIDRPTCEDVSDFDHEAFKCSRCGYRVLSLGGDSCDAVVVSPDGLISEYYYCPNCGKEVVE